MGSREQPLFDLNEPAGGDEENEAPLRFTRRKVQPTVDTSRSNATSSSPHRTLKKRTLSHKSSDSSFQSLNRLKGDQERETSSSSALEKEEGEWSDEDVKGENSNKEDSNDRKSDSATNKREDSVLPPKRKGIKGPEATHALKLAADSGKRPRVDQQKEMMLGKKRSRQTMFLNLNDVKQAGPIKTSTPRRPNFLPPATNRIPKESQPLSDSGESMKDGNQADQSNNENAESSDNKSECNNDDMDSGPVTRSKRTDSGTNLAAEDKVTTDQKQSPLKPTVDSRQIKNAHVPIKRPPLFSQNNNDSRGGLKKLPSKKPATVSTQYHDTSVERLLREVTNDKFWQHPGPCIAEGIPAASCGGSSIFTRACCMEEISSF